MINTVELFCEKAPYIKKVLTYKTPVSPNQTCFSILKELKVYMLKDKSIKKQVVTNLQVLAFISIVVPLYLLQTLLDVMPSMKFSWNLAKIGRTILGIVEILLLNLAVELGLYKEYTIRFIITFQSLTALETIARKLIDYYYSKSESSEVSLALKAYKILKKKKVLQKVLSGISIQNLKRLGQEALQLGKQVVASSIIIQLRYFVYKKLHEFDLDFVSFIFEILYRAFLFSLIDEKREGGQIRWRLKLS